MRRATRALGRAPERDRKNARPQLSAAKAAAFRAESRRKTIREGGGFERRTQRKCGGQLALWDARLSVIAKTPVPNSAAQGHSERRRFERRTQRECGGRLALWDARPSVIAKTPDPTQRCKAIRKGGDSSAALRGNAAGGSRFGTCARARSQKRPVRLGAAKAAAFRAESRHKAIRKGGGFERRTQRKCGGQFALWDARLSGGANLAPQMSASGLLFSGIVGRIRARRGFSASRMSAAHASAISPPSDGTYHENAGSSVSR